MDKEWTQKKYKNAKKQRRKNVQIKQKNAKS